MTSRPCTRSSADGYSLVELLVGLSLLLVVTGGALSLSLSSRRLYELDEARMALHQGIRATKDFVTVDIRQAGERLTPDFPAMEIVAGASTSDPDTLIVRRNLVATVMNSCRDVGATTSRIYIAELVTTPPPGCDPVPDGDGDGWPDNHRIWRDYREANGMPLGPGKYVRAYIWDPVTRSGEFFRYFTDVPADGYITVPPPRTWSTTYPVANRPRVYLLEERRYEVAGDTLQVVINRQSAEAVAIVNGVEDFQLLAHFQSGPTQTALGTADDWMDLRAIEIGMDTAAVVRGESIERGWTASVLPRNVLSR